MLKCYNSAHVMELVKESVGDFGFLDVRRRRRVVRFTGGRRLGTRFEVEAV